MQERNGSVRMFHHRNQVFRFKHKVFLLNIEDNGSMVPIKEMNRQRTYTVRIDFGGVHWLLESLKSAAHQFKDKVFFSRYLASYAMFTLEKYSNKNGSFIRLLEIRKSTVTIIVIFSAGPKGNGWFGLVNSMHSLLYSPSSLNIVNNNKINWTAAKRWKAKPGRKVEGRISYVDAVRKSFVNNIVYKRERQISIEAIGNHAVDWKWVMVCTRENLRDAWNGIQRSLNRLYNTNFQLKPLLPNKAIFICGSEEETEMFGSKNLVFLSGPYAINMQRWDEKEVYQYRKIACIGGWINIHGLPANWWTENVFQIIRERCGGLLEVDARTKKIQNLLMAIIKVKGNHNGFIPASMMIHTASDSEYFAVSLVFTSKLTCELRQMSKNFSSGGTNPIDVPPLSEGEEVVVLEHSTQVDDALAQDKNIMATSTKLICDGETQEKVEDQLNENDLEYESSSFVGNESSTETVVEANTDVIQKHVGEINAMWPVISDHVGTSQDHSHLTSMETTARDAEIVNKTHDGGKLDVVSHRGAE
ncbi:hypothetical protein LguiB_020442 [Lonicera macranthoides]